MISLFRRTLEEFIGLKTLINLYPPYLGAGIKVTAMDKNFDSITVQMNLNILNKNYVGTHFGGSLYSMCDPFYMLILMKKLGKEYIVWDKKASIEFLKSGQGKVMAHFKVTPEELSQIKKTVSEKRKVDWEFESDVLNEGGEVVAKVSKVIYIRKMRSRN